MRAAPSSWTNLPPDDCKARTITAGFSPMNRSGPSFNRVHRHMTPSRSPTPLKSFVVDSLAVEIFARPEELAGSATHAAQAHLQKTLASNGSAAVILAAAVSQVKFLAALVAL